MIQANNLTKYYGPKAAIQDVTFNVQPGEILGFLGPNAAGKTTTMRILTGFLPATSGSAQVAGYDVFNDSLEVRRRIGYLPETVPLYPEMSVRDYLGFFAQVRGVKNVGRSLARVAEMTNIGDRLNDRIGKLSKGYRQRVGLAQALIHDPPVLILDEPTIGLDPKQIIEFRQLIKSLGGEHTIILSTHILPEASQVCERVMIIHEGRIVTEDTPERLTARLQGSERFVLRVRRPAEETVARLKEITGVVNVEPRADGYYEVACALDVDRREEIAATAVQGGWGLLELRPVVMSLEEIFLKLTTKEEAPA
ncbi:MAG: ATP-binding cassette domain-containing protein [Chloroflexi bacterium]|nr:ATP-binding cassette domain-containing protein [Chloroflexota bacterium]